MGLRDLLGGTTKCAICPRTVPKGSRYCPRCAQTGKARPRSGNPTGETERRTRRPTPTVCGTRRANGSVCHKTVSPGETCAH